MSYAQVQAQERYHDQIFAFESEPKTPAAVNTATSSNVSLFAGQVFHNEIPGCEWFFVYPALRARYEIL